jgi:hypothetical protein
VTLGAAGTGDPATVAREAFRDRLLATPGVVSSQGSEDFTGSLVIRPIFHATNAATDANFQRLRSEWETPDGWALSQAVDVWRHARELAVGFHYIWNPRPEREWLNARREWAAFVREVLSRSRSLDTELQVRNAVLSGAA